MPFYLAPYVGTGTEADPYRPEGTDGVDGWSSIDLRPLADYALVSAPALTGPGVVLLADERLENLSRQRRNALASRLGVSLSAGRFDSVVAELLLTHHPRPPKPGRDGITSIWLGELVWAGVRV